MYLHQWGGGGHFCFQYVPSPLFSLVHRVLDHYLELSAFLIGRSRTLYLSDWLRRVKVGKGWRKKWRGKNWIQNKSCLPFCLLDYCANWSWNEYPPLSLESPGTFSRTWRRSGGCGSTPPTSKRLGTQIGSSSGVSSFCRFWSRNRSWGGVQSYSFSLWIWSPPRRRWRGRKLFPYTLQNTWYG